MKTKLFVVLALVLVFALSLFGSQTTVTGVLTDDMCTKKHMMPGKENAECVRDCIKHGAKYVVVANGKVFELSGNREQFYALAGKKVTLVGDVKASRLVVTSIEAVQ